MDTIKQAISQSTSLQSLIDKYHQNPSLFPHHTYKGDFLYWKNRLLIPPESTAIINQILHEFHSSPLGGHAGFLRTHARIATYFFWPHMRKDIRTFIAACLVCQ